MELTEIFLRIINEIRRADLNLIDPIFMSSGITKITNFISNMDRFIDFNFTVLTYDINIETSIHEFIDNQLFKEEFINDNEKSRSYFTNLSPILTIMLNRTRFEKGKIINDKKENQIMVDDELQIPVMELKDGIFTKKSDENYAIWGIIVHSGATVHSGHFTCFIKIFEEWYYFNDTKVFVVEEKLVFNMASESDTVGVVMAFYVKKELKDHISYANAEYFVNSVISFIQKMENLEKQKTAAEYWNLMNKLN